MMSCKPLLGENETLVRDERDGEGRELRRGERAWKWADGSSLEGLCSDELQEYRGAKDYLQTYPLPLYCPCRWTGKWLCERRTLAPLPVFSAPHVQQTSVFFICPSVLLPDSIVHPTITSPRPSHSRPSLRVRRRASFSLRALLRAPPGASRPHSLHGTSSADNSSVWPTSPFTRRSR